MARLGQNAKPSGRAGSWPTGLLSHTDTGPPKGDDIEHRP